MRSTAAVLALSALPLAACLLPANGEALDEQATSRGPGLASGDLVQPPSPARSIEALVDGCGQGTAEQPFAPFGTRCGEQAEGDCSVSMCNGAGSCFVAWDGFDVAFDEDPCTLDYCGEQGTQREPCDGCACAR